MGTDLEGALDPLGDQTYFYSAARWRRTAVDGTVEVDGYGVSPRKSHVWTRRSKSKDAFISDAADALKRAAMRTRDVPRPLPALAGDASFQEIHTAYDVTLVPEPAADDEEEIALEGISLETDPRGKRKALVRVSEGGAPIGRLQLTPDMEPNVKG